MQQTGGVLPSEAAEVIAKGFPPIADHIALVDFDGTMYPWGYLFSYPEPLPGAVEALQRLRMAGYTLVVFTSRLSPRWLATVGQTREQHITYIKEICFRDGIVIADVTCEKIPAQIYIDDRAYRFDGDWNDVVTKILQ